MRTYKSVALVAVAGVLLAACAAGVNPQVDVPDEGGRTAGFFFGLWHGIIMPIAFVISLFTDRVSIYDVNNTGGWYDFGYLLGLCISLGGGAKAGWRDR
jgi:hypothetical protein